MSPEVTGEDAAPGRFDPHELARRVVATGAKFHEIHASFSVGLIHDAIALLGRLEHELRHHFAVEEDPGGSFDEILLRAPQLEARLASLRKDHAPMREEVAKLREEARAAGVTPEAWAHVAAHFRAFAEGLRRHESAEDAVVADALMTDEPA